jgi:hypothetical protein
MAEKSGYKKRIAEQAKLLLDSVAGEFEKDRGEHGGAAEMPNFGKWLDRTRKLYTQLDEAAKGWSRADIEEIVSSSRNAVTFGDPRQRAYFALYEDVLREVKKHRKQGA